MLKKRTHTKRKAQNKQNLVAFAWWNPVPNSEPNPNFQLCANVCPAGRWCCCRCCLWLSTGVTDTRSGCRCRSGTSQGAPSAGKAAGGESHVTTRRRLVALHVKFSSLRWKFKSKEMQIRMWMRMWIRMWVWLRIWVRSGLCGTHLVMIHHSGKREGEGRGRLPLFRCLLARLLRLL